MKKILLLLLIINTSVCKIIAQGTLQNKPAKKVLVAFYTGGLFSVTPNNGNAYTGGFMGFQTIIKGKHFITTECGYTRNNNFKGIVWTWSTGGPNEVNDKVNFEICYGRSLFTSKEDGGKIIWQVGIGRQYIDYQGAYVGGFYSYDYSQFWQP